MAGSATGATLLVVKPDSVSNNDVVSYLIQAYSDAEATEKVGIEVKGVNRADGADGSEDKPLEFFVPYTTPAQLTFIVTADAGTTRSMPSLASTPVVVGE